MLTEYSKKTKKVNLLELLVERDSYILTLEVELAKKRERLLKWDVATGGSCWVLDSIRCIWNSEGDFTEGISFSSQRTDDSWVTSFVPMMGVESITHMRELFMEDHDIVKILKGRINWRNRGARTHAFIDSYRSRLWKAVGKCVEDACTARTNSFLSMTEENMLVKYTTFVPKGMQREVVRLDAPKKEWQELHSR